MEYNDFTFNGVILQEETEYTSLCLDLDVASQGETVQEAKEALLEAVTLYLETAVEHQLPWLRPVPVGDDPRFVAPDTVAEEFVLKVHIAIHAYA